jgi:tetraacyldisaccharide 4'-kinase
MFGTAPAFWWSKPGLQAWVLAPLSWAYGKVAGNRMRGGISARAPLPVICVGNFTVGGSGKTPLALAVAKAAKAEGFKPGFITRGHGGTVKQTRLAVDTDTAATIGDEAMLLARASSVAVGADRLAGANLLAEAGCTIAIMDDGFQSRSIAIDHAMIAVDARRGIGNSFVMPSGPLRAALNVQMPFADQIIIVGEGEAGDAVVRTAARAAKPVARATLKPGNIGRVKGKSVMAFAGIADPEKFYATLRSMGAIVSKTRSFPDHHAFTDNELRSLIDDSGDLLLVTTEKDEVRISDETSIGTQLKKRLLTVPVQIVMQDDAVMKRALDEAVKRFKDR